MNNTTPRFRAGTVVWGCVLLVIAAIAFSVVAFDLREFQGAAVVWIVTGLGALFVVAAIIALIARSISSNRDEAEVPAPVAAAPEAPVATRNRKPKGQPVD